MREAPRTELGARVEERYRERLDRTGTSRTHGVASFVVTAAGLLIGDAAAFVSNLREQRAEPTPEQPPASPAETAEG